MNELKAVHGALDRNKAVRDEELSLEATFDSIKENEKTVIILSGGKSLCARKFVWAP